MLRAMRAENSVGSPRASSYELVCSDCVPPMTAAMASMVVRMMLLYGSCSVREYPDVWQCVLRRKERDEDIETQAPRKKGDESREEGMGQSPKQRALAVLGLEVLGDQLVPQRAGGPQLGHLSQTQDK